MLKLHRSRQTACSTRALSLEALESRVVLSTFTVINTADRGAGSLRDAIDQANATTGDDLIEFQIPGTGPHVIAPESPLPPITNPLTIDGYTQSGSAVNTSQHSSNAVLMVELDGAGAGTANGLSLVSSGSTVRGLAIHSFDGPNGIAVQGNNNVIEGNFIGTDATGTTVGLGNAENGIAMAAVQSNRIGTDGDGVNDLGERNVIVGHPSAAVRINGSGTRLNVVAGNFLGTDASGNQAISNATGVLLFAGAEENMIGGSGVARNVISGNSTYGVSVGSSGNSSHNNLVVGNFIGTNGSGEAALPNGIDGVNVGSASQFNQIAGNVVSGNGRHGVFIDKAGADNNLILGNKIGTNAAGFAAVANQGHGVVVSFGPNGTRIVDNIVSGNANSGVFLQGTAAVVDTEDNIVAGNVIGAGSDGTTAIPNGQHGVLIRDATNNLIGTDGDGVDDNSERNTIAFNAGSGIVVADSGSDVTGGNQLRGNSIHGNGQLGIDLGEDGVAANDADDVDIGPNGLQNFPVLASAEAGAGTRVVGSFQGHPNTNLTVEFFASPAADASGHGEGQRYLGSTPISTDATGQATFDVLLVAPTALGEWVAATATDLMCGDTSEFSLAISATTPAVQQVEIDIKPGSDNNPLNLTSQGVIAVALLTTADFDASTVDIGYVTFAEAEVAHHSMEDVDGDGDLDLMLHFRTEDTNLEYVYAQLIDQDADIDGVMDSSNRLAQVSLSGQTTAGTQFEGVDEMDLFLRGRALRELVDELFGA